ncbi:aldehyde dehydrogenase family protein [Alteribacillus persepolensis]|uniref:aldehyde dehydrogenase family protein n=1 Tax=Alteribacillus persepolensis TaxID=568899 RepID=UPI001113DF1B
MLVKGCFVYFIIRQARIKLLLSARQIESGVTGINGSVDSSLGMHEVPFGGVKQSGIGWERGKAGLKEYVHYHGITYHK